MGVHCQKCARHAVLDPAALAFPPIRRLRLYREKNNGQAETRERLATPLDRIVRNAARLDAVVRTKIDSAQRNRVLSLSGRGSNTH
jgi:hypothetical protein